MQSLWVYVLAIMAASFDSATWCGQLDQAAEVLAGATVTSVEPPAFCALCQTKMPWVFFK